LKKRKKKIKKTQVKPFNFRQVKRKQYSVGKTKEEEALEIKEKRLKLYNKIKSQAPFYAPTTIKQKQMEQHRIKQLQAQEEKKKKKN